MTKLTVVDPHIHLWDLSTGLYPALDAPSDRMAEIAKTYLLPDLLADAGDITVAKAVHVEAFPSDPIAETLHVQAMADAAGNGIPQGIVGNADFTQPDVEATLAAQAECANFRGIRQVVNLHDNPEKRYVTKDYLNDAAWVGNLKLLTRYNASFDLQLYPHQMADAARVIGTTPDVMFIVNHAGMFTDRTLEGWQIWKAGMCDLAARDNVCVKISGLGMFDRNWSLESIRPYVLETLTCFGTDRAMFASNFPVDKMFSSYEAVWKAFDEIVADLSDVERAGLMQHNAERYYRI